ncbi:MAG TPA: hypothetical protein VMP68_08865 [Candidatus Eisenbacteria bacterium]|nr:hypothetical protein [Candidatus Eisenbacteria bacterium]
MIISLLPIIQAVQYDGTETTADECLSLASISSVVEDETAAIHSYDENALVLALTNGDGTFTFNIPTGTWVIYAAPGGFEMGVSSESLAARFQTLAQVRASMGL